MKIKEIEHRSIISVTTEDGTEYTRHSADCWMQSYGMSQETVQDTTEIEAAYQEFIKPTEDDIQMFNLMSEQEFIERNKEATRKPDEEFMCGCNPRMSTSEFGELMRNQYDC